MIKFFRQIRQKLLAEGKTRKYLKYAIGEIILIVIGIVIALQLSTLKEAEDNKMSEQKILSEIRNGIWRDLADFEKCMYQNQYSLAIAGIVKDYINKKSIDKDSLSRYFNSLIHVSRPVINKAGYESLKSSGLKTITNDSLRFQIAQLYDYYYTLVENSMIRQQELQTFSIYNPIIIKLYPFLEFDETGDILSASTPLLNDLDQKELLRFLDLIIDLRERVLSRFGKIAENVKQLSVNIDKELDQYIPPERLQQYTGTFEVETNSSGQKFSQKRKVTYSVEDNYLTSTLSWHKEKRSFYMIAPDEFENLTLISSSGKRTILHFNRDANQNITSIHRLRENGIQILKKIE